MSGIISSIRGTQVDVVLHLVDRDAVRELTFAITLELVKEFVELSARAPSEIGGVDFLNVLFEFPPEPLQLHHFPVISKRCGRMSPNGDYGYYGDGLAEEITTTLASVEGLHVVPRTTAFAFRDHELGAVGEDLQVDAVLQGSVRKSGDTLRIAAQLIRASDGRQIWNESYEEADDSAFQVQEGIARSVATAIEKELGVSESPTPLPEAYEEYLKGRYELSRTTPASVNRAILLFESAIEADPDYASAHAGLVQAYVVNVLWGFAAPNETRELAREATELALALDEGDHEEALAAAAAYELIYEWDMEPTQELLDRAADAGIRSEAIHTMQGLLFTAQHRLDEAQAELEKSIEIAPNVLLQEVGVR